MGVWIRKAVIQPCHYGVMQKQEKAQPQISLPCHQLTNNLLQCLNRPSGADDMQVHVCDTMQSNIDILAGQAHGGLIDSPQFTEL